MERPLRQLKGSQKELEVPARKLGGDLKERVEKPSKAEVWASEADREAPESAGKALEPALKPSEAAG